MKTPYAIGFVVALFLHLLLPEDKEEDEEKTRDFLSSSTASA